MRVYYGGDPFDLALVEEFKLWLQIGLVAVKDAYGHNGNIFKSRTNAAKGTATTATE